MATLSRNWTNGRTRDDRLSAERETTKLHKRSPEEQRGLSQEGGYLSAARTSPEAKKAQGAKGFRNLIIRDMSPAQRELERTHPALFDRAFAAAAAAHMAAMQAARRAKAAERKAERKAPKTAAHVVVPVPFLWTSCPECNASQGITLPDGVPTALCVKHYLCGKPWYPLGAHEWAIRKPWLLDRSL